MQDARHIRNVPWTGPSRYLQYGSVFLLSLVVLCYEIISTRISSVIFVNDHACIILSLSMLGLGCGSVYSYSTVRTADANRVASIISRAAVLTAGTLILFVVAVTGLSLTSPLPFFLLTFLPFFMAGIVYSQIYRLYALQSFTIYAADVVGGAAGALLSLGLLTIVGAPNSIQILAVFMLIVSLNFMGKSIGRNKTIAGYAILLVILVLLMVNGKNEYTGHVPIGNYDGKDYYHVYPDAASRAAIIDSRWSMYGRSDLVQYTDQDVVRQLFIDGAAGTQMYKFNGNLKKCNPPLLDLLLQHSNAIPFLVMNENQKRTMLVIGPGGGKEILLGLFGGASQITGVEINSDFVNIVKAAVK